MSTEPRQVSDLQTRTRFDPGAVEPALISAWLASGLFHPEPEGDAAENYSIAIPPPNITGALHMGHALNGSIQDTLIRYHRMLGQRTKWIFGTDHASIATQTQVERALLAEGTSREEIGREAFIERAWRWREQYGARIVEQYKRLGASCDYADERFTLDERYADAVLTVFIELYERGLIHRDNYMVNWDPGSRSAISESSAAPPAFSTRTANSSLPQRATVSWTGTMARIRRAAWASTRSPAPCPIESLTAVKRSRSRKMTPIRRALVASRSTSRARSST